MNLPSELRIVKEKIGQNKESDNQYKQTEERHAIPTKRSDVLVLNRPACDAYLA